MQSFKQTPPLATCQVFPSLIGPIQDAPWTSFWTWCDPHEAGDTVIFVCDAEKSPLCCQELSTLWHSTSLFSSLHSHSRMQHLYLYIILILPLSLFSATIFSGNILPGKSEKRLQMIRLVLVLTRHASTPNASELLHLLKRYTTITLYNGYDMKNTMRYHIEKAQQKYQYWVCNRGSWIWQFSFKSLSSSLLFLQIFVNLAHVLWYS